MNVTVDAYDGVCNVHCSLRDAVWEANNNPGADTILIPAATTVALGLPGSGEDGNVDGDLDLWDDNPSTLTIASSIPGTLATITVTGTEERIFHVIDSTAAIDLHLVDVHLKNAATAPTGPRLMGGGCVANENSGTVNLEHGLLEACTYMGTSAPGSRGGGAVDSLGPVTLLDDTLFLQNWSRGRGGALFVDGALSVDTSSFVGNEARWDSGLPIPSDGGAVYAVGGPVAVTTGTLRSNTAEGRGGALALIGNPGGGALSMTDSAITYNTARRPSGAPSAGFAIGGGLYVTDQDATIGESDLWFNEAVSYTTSLFPTFAGAVDLTGGSLTITGSYLLENRATQEGGAVRVVDGDVVLVESQFEANEAVELTAATSSPIGGAVYARNSTCTVTDSEFEANRIAGQGIPLAGALYLPAPPTDDVVVERSTFVYNVAEDTTPCGTPPCAGTDDAYGGAVVIGQTPVATTTTATIRNSTFTENYGDVGGAIYSTWRGGSSGAAAHDLRLEYVTFVQNDAAPSTDGEVLFADANGVVTFVNSLIHESVTMDAPCTTAVSGAVASGGGNYLDASIGSPAACNFDTSLGDLGDVAKTGSPMGLAYWGNPTRLHRLMPGHPARPLAACLPSVAEDQHQDPRPTSGTCTAGAWEAP